MAHARSRILATRPKLELSEAVWNYLCDIPIPGGDSETHFEILMLEAGDGEDLREVWTRARGEVLGAWVKDHAGSRPSAWWRCEAPRLPLGTWAGCYWDGRLPEPRKFISGAGCDASLISAYAPGFTYGLPTCWAGYEEENPPTFESQSSYLRRHNLLTPGELRALTVADYERFEVLPAECEVLSVSEEWVRQRIPAARKGLGFFDCEQTGPY